MKKERIRILVTFSIIIILLIVVFALFDWGILMKIVLGVVALGVLVFAYGLLTSEEVAQEVDLDTNHPKEKD